MCNLGGILDIIGGGLFSNPQKDANKAAARAEAARVAKAEQIKQDEAAKRKKKRAERIPVETLIAGEDAGVNLGV